MTREIAHMRSFMLALESLGKDLFSIGEIPPSADLARTYFNDSTGREDGIRDFRGPWNEGGDWRFMESPAFQELREEMATKR